MTALLLLLLVGILGCATNRLASKADDAFARENWDAAVAYYQEALDRSPGNRQYQIRLKRSQAEASQVHQAAGRRLWDTGDLEGAALEYELALRLDSTNELASSEYGHIREALRAEAAAPREPSRLERIKAAASVVDVPIPRLRPRIDQTISLSFRDASALDIYRALAAIAGLNVVFDNGIQDRQADLMVQNVGFFEALSAFANSQGHFYKAISSDTFIVVMDNPNKRAQFGEELMRTYYLSNATAENVGRMFGELLQTQRVSINPDLNTVTLRDSAAVVAQADRIVSMVDKARGEVLLDIEILEANRRVLREYGISLEPSSEITQSLAQGEEGQGISLQRLRYINANDWFVTVPSIRYRLFKESGDFKLVADPQLRLTEGQEAALLIGNEVPVVITTFNPTQLAGNQVVPIRSTDYRDVGISVDALTRVHHNEEVTLELSVEVSSIAGTGIENLPIFGTRQISTVTRLRDGETHVLAGLLRDDERTSLTGIPGLSDLPLIGRLFGSTSTEVEQNDVIMTITPHILRAADLEMEDLEALYIGRQNSPDLDGLSRSGTPEVQTEPAESAAPAGGALLALVPASETIGTGEELVIALEVEGLTDARAVTLRLQYDAESFSFVGTTPGRLLQEVGRIMPDPTFDANGSLVWTLSDAEGLRGTGRLGELRFRALAKPGLSTFALDSEISGADAERLPSRDLGAVVGIAR